MAVYRKTASVSRTNAGKALRERRENCFALLEELQAKLAVHGKGASRPLSWGFAGDLAHVEELLQQAVDFLPSPETRPQSLWQAVNGNAQSVGNPFIAGSEREAMSQAISRYGYEIIYVEPFREVAVRQ